MKYQKFLESKIKKGWQKLPLLEWIGMLDSGYSYIDKKEFLFALFYNHNIQFTCVSGDKVTGNVRGIFFRTLTLTPDLMFRLGLDKDLDTWKSYSADLKYAVYIEKEETIYFDDILDKMTKMKRETRFGL